MGCLIGVMNKVLNQQTYNLSSENLHYITDPSAEKQRRRRSEKGGNRKKKDGGRSTVDYSNKELADFRVGRVGSSWYIKSRIRVLRLDNNYLRTLPHHVVAFKNLKEIYVQHNDFEYIPSQIWALKRLEVIDLSFNAIYSLPNGVLQDLVHLKKFILSYNQLYELPDDFKCLKNLRELYLDGNAFVQMPPSMLELPQLEILQINKNSISYLPKNLVNLKELKNLNIADNQIVSMHVDTVHFLGELPVLEASSEISMKLHIEMTNKVTMLKLPNVPYC